MIRTLQRKFVFTAMAGTSNTLFIGLPLTTQLFGEVSIPFLMTYYLSSAMFQNDVFVGLKPLWTAEPDVKIYTVA